MKSEGRLILIACAILVAAGWLAFARGLSGPFVFDDRRAILDNPSIRSLWPPWGPLSTPRDASTRDRPLANLSLAVNYAIGKQDPWGYHAFNVAVHILAALTLFGILRRTLLSPRAGPLAGRAASLLALAIALVWTVHPLQTESVTYIVQRCESMAGLFYLATLYCAIRSFRSPRAGLWRAAAVTCCAAGMGSKEYVGTAPLIVLAYDRLFEAGSWRELFRRRWPLYAGLAATWALVAFLALDEYRSLAPRAWTQLEYALTQFGVILYYLGLCVWPSPLCIDHQWPLAHTADQIVPQAIAVGLLVAVTIWALVRRPAVGFIGLWFFIALAPTSSICPLMDLCCERRMYLALAAVVAAAAIGLYVAGRRVLERVVADARKRGRIGLLIGAAVTVAACAALGTATDRRNADYLDETALWGSVLKSYPGNIRARYNLGEAYARAGQTRRAIQEYEEVLRVQPDSLRAQYNLGVDLMRLGDCRGAVARFREALRVQPDFSPAYYSMAQAFVRLGESNEAIRAYGEAIRLAPSDAAAHHDLGIEWMRRERLPEAIAEFRQAAELGSDRAEMHTSLAMALAAAGQPAEAERCYRRAIEVEPQGLAANYNYGTFLLQLNRPAEALPLLRTAAKLAPGSADAHFNLANALLATGRTAEAVGELEHVLRISPGDVQARSILSQLRADPRGRP